jgi:hypothetical protein
MPSSKAPPSRLYKVGHFDRIITTQALQAREGFANRHRQKEVISTIFSQVTWEKSKLGFVKISRLIGSILELLIYAFFPLTEIIIANTGTKCNRKQRKIPKNLALENKGLKSP